MQSDFADLTPKARRTRASLLDAGRRLYGLHGVAGVNVMSVCAEAGVGRTSFYNYFDDVEGLVGTLALDAAKDMKAKFDHLHSDQPRGRKRLRACLKMILTLAVEEPATALLVTSLAQSSPKVGDLLSTEIHAELSAESDLSIEDVQGLTEFLSIATFALTRELAEGNPTGVCVDRYMEILWRCVP